MAFTKQQNTLIELLSNPNANDVDVPHLGDLSAALTRAFGGVQALADMLATLANDASRPDWLRCRAFGLIINSLTAAAKLADSEPNIDDRPFTENELKHAATCIMREVLGITDAMEGELKTLVAAWPELPAETRTAIVGLAADTTCKT